MPIFPAVRNIALITDSRGYNGQRQLSAGDFVRPPSFLFKNDYKEGFLYNAQVPINTPKPFPLNPI
jgi:hypothetical protein